MENHDGHSHNHPDAALSRAGVVWKGAAMMIAVTVVFYILREHWGHALGIAPYLLLLACPIMHIFMHGGHGHQHDGGRKGRD